MTTRIKPNLSKQFEEEPVEYSGKWKNCYFRKDGSTLLATKTFGSISEAKAADASIHRAKGDDGWKNDNGKMLYKDHHYTIQIPVRS